MRKFLKALFFFCFLVGGAFAQDYPSKPVRFIVGFPPGGSTDILGRLIAQSAKERGWEAVVDNRPGAMGTIGNNAVAKADPDGYTLLVAGGSVVVAVPHLRVSLPYDALNDLLPVVQISTHPAFLASEPTFEAKTISELITLAKKRPGSLNLGSPGVGSAYHLAIEWFNGLAGTNIQHVPYQGGAAVLNGLLGKQVHLLFDSASFLKPLVDSGKVRLIAVTGSKRDPQFPEIPTIAETFTGFEITAWLGIFVPKGTPPKIVGYLNKEISLILTMPEMMRVWKDRGMEFVPNSQEEFAVFVKKEYDRYGDLIRKIGIKPQ
ncbi:MAG: tripartite tricarboxylate transporter substrate binding protein [Patescibacteria group bacterium]